MAGSSAESTIPEARPLMAPSLQITRGGSPEGDAHFVRLESGDAVELYACVRPQARARGIQDQAASVYANLRVLLKQQDVRPQDVLTERLFFADIAAHTGAAHDARADFYGTDGPDLPASTFLQQPPAADGRLLELQVYVLYSPSGTQRVEAVAGLPAATEGKRVTEPGLTHIHLQNLTADDALCAADFRSQCQGLFDQIGRVLDDHGLSVQQLLRTWIYLRDLDLDYGVLNEVRNACFAEWGVTYLPASTGIEGGTHPTTWRICADVCIGWGDNLDEIDEMHGESLGNAFDYGSAFSRGLCVQRMDRTLLYVSGTASIDTEGNVVHVGDIEGQCRRMLDNVEALLRPHGATLADSINAVTYLKQRQFLPVFEQVCRERGVPADLLNTIVVADVCRPDWLCEIELTAVLTA
jgi:enamine deaminase RidA (YjgF/YER057c/UK114 family)